jgi:hypothetical protein
MAYDNTNSGVLFKNHKKTESKHPDYQGNLDVGGKKFKLAAWIKEIKQGQYAGQKMMSLAVTPEGDDDLAQDEPAKKEPPADDIPF